MVLIFLYSKLVCGNTDTYFKHTLVTGIAPAFYKSTKKDSRSQLIRCYLSVLRKYGLDMVWNSVILHLITLMIYSTMGAILRNTMFHFNINIHYGNNTDIIKGHINETMRPNTIERNPEIQAYLDKVVFEQPLHNFPVHLVVWYYIFIGVYVVLSVIYYCAFHPWKILKREKKSNGHVLQELPHIVPNPNIHLHSTPHELPDQNQCQPQEHDDETLACTEITHL